MNTIMTTRWSRMSMIFCFVAVSAKGGQGPSKWSQPYVGRALDRGLAVVVPGDDPALGLKAFQIASPFSRPKHRGTSCLSTSDGQRAEPLAGGQVEEVAEQALALSRGSCWSWRRLSTRCSQVRAPARATGRACRHAPADDVGEQLHVLADRGQLGERAEEQPLAGSWFQPSNG